MTNYQLRDREELLKEWALLKSREQYFKDELIIILKDIHADRAIIEIELRLLETLGKGKWGDH